MITSTLNDKSTNFIDAVINSIPSYDSLWFLDKINKFEPEFFNDIEKHSFQELAYLVFDKLNFLNDFNQIDNSYQEILKKSIVQAFNFPIELTTLDKGFHILECFHGPTLTFKDFGARFMACFIDNYQQLTKFNKKFTILVATSGDTGSAIASGFYKKENISVIILYPLGKISKMQELQITTYGENVTAYGIEGTFDDCQKLVKKAFTDNDLSFITNSNLNLVSANSINLARLLPQSLYYFYSYGLLKKKLKNNDIQPIFSVPCGNCGNLTGGIIAKKMGLPIKLFIAGQNRNQTFHTYLHTGYYQPSDTIKTISNAMDVSDPNNFKRIKYIYSNNCNNNEYDTIELMKKDISSYFIDDSETLDTIKLIKNQYNYLIDPHTSVAVSSMIKYDIENNFFDKYNEEYIIISTAHPSKFDNIITSLNIDVSIHPNLLKIQDKFQEKIIFKNNYDLFKKILFKSNFNNIVLIGMPGAGKSTISKYISNNYKFSNITELDHLIEKNTLSGDLKLPDIIKQIGYDDFNKIEEEFLIKSINLKQKDCINIISTGGSVIYHQKGMEYIKKNAFIIYLNVDKNTILKRTDNLSNRGIIFKNNNIDQFFEEREKIYNFWTDVEINCNQYNVQELGNLIINKFIKKNI